MKLGMAMAARMPMIATTIINSIKVKPRWLCLDMQEPPNKTGRDGRHPDLLETTWVLPKKHQLLVSQFTSFHTLCGSPAATRTS
jgi:hypothetical protein